MNILKEIRETSGLTQLQVAEKSNITVMTYFRYEAGERVPNAHTAQLIARALGSTVEDLFPLPERQFRETEKHPDSNQVNQQLNHSIKRYDM